MFKNRFKLLLAIGLLLTIVACTPGTDLPTVAPTAPAEPQAEPTTAEPTAVSPTEEPTAVPPTEEPTAEPPTAEPPTAEPTAEPPAAEPTLAPEVDVTSLLNQALLDGDYAAIQGFMGDSFSIGYWLSEGVVMTPAEASEQLQKNLLPNPSTVTVDGSGQLPDLGSFDPYSAFGPDVQIVDLLFSQGWSEGGNGEAILVIAQKPDGEQYFHGLIYAGKGFGVPSVPSGSGDVSSILGQALNSANYAALQSLMGDPFIIGYWQSEGQVLSPAEASEQLQLSLLPNPTAVSLISDPQQFPDLGGLDPATAFGPTVPVTDVFFSQGWGPDGAAEAFIVMSSTAAGEPVWSGLIYAPAGF